MIPRLYAAGREAEGRAADFDQKGDTGGEVGENSERERLRDARLIEALDVPDDLYDAADSSGAALLAGMLCGHRRMLVDISDPSLEEMVQDGALVEGSSDRLARFVELMCLPICAALEGLDGLEQNRVHIMFQSVRNLMAARNVMSIASDSKVGLGAMSVDSTLAPCDAVLVLVAPSVQEGGPDLQALLKAAENRTIIVVNPVFPRGTRAAVFELYEPVYYLKGMSIAYHDKDPEASNRLESDRGDIGERAGLGLNDDPDTSVFGEFSLGDFSPEAEREALEEVGLLLAGEAKELSGSPPDQEVGLVPTEAWAAAAAAAVTATEVSDEAFDGVDDSWRGPSERSDPLLFRSGRAVLLREFPTAWRAFLQLADEDEDGVEQPWVLADSFEGKPDQSELKIALMAFIENHAGYGD